MVLHLWHCQIKGYTLTTLDPLYRQVPVQVVCVPRDFSKLRRSFTFKLERYTWWVLFGGYTVNHLLLTLLICTVYLWTFPCWFCVSLVSFAPLFCCLNCLPALSSWQNRDSKFDFSVTSVSPNILYKDQNPLLHIKKTTKFPNFPPLNWGHHLVWPQWQDPSCRSVALLAVVFIPVFKHSCNIFWMWMFKCRFNITNFGRITSLCKNITH